jgi:hypothetical protein
MFQPRGIPVKDYGHGCLIGQPSADPHLRIGRHQGSDAWHGVRRRRQADGNAAAT